jgi:CMP-N-acetylneuraminic acid synthetase
MARDVGSPEEPALRLVALVPMRHASERIPGKNYREVAGRPLYAYILESLLGCPEIELIVVDTDSPPVREGVAKAFPEVRLLDRPEDLRAADIPMNQIIAHDVTVVPAELYLQTHSTSPLLRPATISAAIQAFRNAPDHDSLLSVTALYARLWSPEGEPINHDPGRLLRTQDLPPVYLENSCLYVFRRDRFWSLATESADVRSSSFWIKTKHGMWTGKAI